MKRRKFIIFFITGLLLTAVISWLYRLRVLNKKTESWFPQTLANICSEEQLKEFGLQYRQISGENQADSLISLLLDGHSSPLLNRRSFLDKKIAEDFQSGNTVLINGWLLSKTEARQCALITLKNKKE